ncbi:MAG: c-type cytochrome, partial [Geminicoccaceae bacterium]
FLRGSDVLDPENGGFEAPECSPEAAPDQGQCFDTSELGNGRGGHAYGTDLPPEARAKLLSYLKTF